MVFFRSWFKRWLSWCHGVLSVGLSLQLWSWFLNVVVLFETDKKPDDHQYKRTIQLRELSERQQWIRNQHPGLARCSGIFNIVCRLSEAHDLIEQLNMMNLFSQTHIEKLLTRSLISSASFIICIKTITQPLTAFDSFPKRLEIQRQGCFALKLK